MKLLEVHYAAKDANAFEQLAQEVHSRKGDDNSYWGRIAAMGAELVPGSALFAASGDALPDFDADAVIPEKPATTDLELDADESTSDTTELELPESDESATGQADELDLASDLAEFENEAATQAGTAAETDETDVSSELEFDLGELNDQDNEQPAGESLSAEDELDLEDEDFSLDFDAADLGFEEPEDDRSETESATDSSDELNLDEDLDLGVALDESSEGAAATDTADDVGLDSALDSELDFDASELNLDDDSGSADDEISLDMGDDLETETADLDLDDSLDLSDDSSDSGIASDGDDDFDISELSDDIDEVATKLDLAKAYIDMGDSDGARSILEEVKAEGNESQQQEAEALLKQAD
jgi:pilus assembly protein FimV